MKKTEVEKLYKVIKFYKDEGWISQKEKSSKEWTYTKNPTFNCEKYDYDVIYNTQLQKLNSDIKYYVSVKRTDAAQVVDIIRKTRKQDTSFSEDLFIANVYKGWEPNIAIWKLSGNDPLIKSIAASGIPFKVEIDDIYYDEINEKIY